MKLQLFEARTLGPLVTFLDANGPDAQPLLDRVHIPRELIDQGGWVTARQFYDFTLEVVRRVGVREVVCEAYLEFQLDHLNAIHSAMRSCKTVKESLDIATRIGVKAYQGCEYFLRIEGDTTWFCFRNPGFSHEARPFVNDITRMVYYHLIRATADQNWRPQRMQIQEPGNVHLRALPIFLDCQIVFDPHLSALAFPTEFLRRRVPWCEKVATFEESDAWEFPPREKESFVDALYRLIASRFRYDELPNLDQVAQMSGISGATLKRRLTSAGMTYRGLLDRLRFDTACEMLSIPEMSVKEIALELGFSDSNNFVRSFRRMTGVTPGQYRRAKR